MKPGLFDTHCHLNLPPLAENLENLLVEAKDAGISSWLVPGIESSAWQSIQRISDYSSIFPAYGIHPSSVSGSTESDLKLLDRMAPGALAIGEVGLDRNAGNPPLQEKFLREQIRIARRHSLPLLIHCCRNVGRLQQILQEESAHETGGIMHAFSGSLESATQFIKMGFAISISGSVTRPEARRVHRLAAELPLSSLVIETDAPYMIPQCRLNTYNRPLYLLDIISTIASIRSASPESIAEATSSNARQTLFISKKSGIRPKPQITY